MINKIITEIFGQKVNGNRIFPLSTKIILIFTAFILISNLSSNYINMVYSRSELNNLLRELLVKDLKDMFSFTSNQYEIYRFSNDLDDSVRSIENKALAEFKKSKSVFLGIKENGNFMFQASKAGKMEIFSDSAALQMMVSKQAAGNNEGIFFFTYNDSDYFGVYKYNPKWKIFLVRAEEIEEFEQVSSRIFNTIAIIIVILTIISSVIGVVILRHITRFIPVITNAIIRMTNNQSMEFIDLKGASLDDITFLGMAFNSLSSTINNLLFIFRKFVNKDIALKAYREKNIRLEGSQRELTMLFTDIKGFTMITETLGTDIIKLINMHYDRAIREIINHNGVIGSIIGDALLSVFGTLDEPGQNKSYEAVLSAYRIQDVAEILRMEMHQRKENMIARKGQLTAVEEKVYQAVLIEVGVGVDGGDVFYGNIGSYERMTNTVIGDTVNSASRLEGLTRVYKVPVIISEYVKDDIEKNVTSPGMVFVEIDTVQVKGKTVGKKVYWPILAEKLDEELEKELALFNEGLQLYYAGQWTKAYKKFNSCTLGLAEVFKERTKGTKCPKEWNGIWTMTTK